MIDKLSKDICYIMNIKVSPQVHKVYMSKERLSLPLIKILNPSSKVFKWQCLIIFLIKVLYFLTNFT